MAFDPITAEIRFGTGLSPLVAPPGSVAAMLDALTGPDMIAARFPIPSYEEFRTHIVAVQRTGKAFRDDKTGPDAAALRKAYDRAKQAARRDQSRWMMQVLARRSHTADGFRERLAAFWGDHFTVRGKGAAMRRAGAVHVESYVRPHVAGRFADLLIAAATSPVMVNYLDQQFSVGPNAPARARMPATRGLNENLAREVLELHTLGVDGPYSQDDVRQLAELLTGLAIGPGGVPEFRDDWAEPGAETVLGRSYGGGAAALADIQAALSDLVVHPATARHLSWKLAVHFIADDPDPSLVQAMQDAWLATGGDLLPVYRAMLDHPAAWAPERRNVKPPFDFFSSALRALAVDPEPIRGKPNDVEQRIRKLFLIPLTRMGQRWDEPGGPDGWPEEDEAWITPQGLAARLEWALQVPRVLTDLPDPREFALQALGPAAPETVRFAARAAESRHEGIALVLISPAFQRR
ncbi:DUF1800 domain-containing protein [Thalassovita sp.]|uniref:DUF1800 domain-containing protein n=1 Tax=Thalassovita sp. TaxID=1979401 RepID=UPI0029DE6928|nr:DUF1800 domain-containing protein [Thalassovita sp.]